MLKYLSKKRTRLYIWLLSAAVIASTGFASPVALETDQTTRITNTITEAELRTHVYFLASDSLQGRMTGSAGHEIAVQYADSVFRQAGLSPILSDSEGVKTFLQPVPFRMRKSDDRSRLTIKTVKKKKTFKEQDDFKCNPFCISDFPDKSLPVVFVGYGIEEPAQGWNDFENIDDLNGKIALMLLGTPQIDGIKVLPDQVHYKYETIRGNIHRYRAIVKRNAEAVILVMPGDNRQYWNSFNGPSYRVSMMYEGGATKGKNGQIHEGPPHNRMYIKGNVLKSIFKGQPYSPAAKDDFQESEYKPGLLPGVTITYKKTATGERFDSWNVVALVEGTDPVLKDEFITIGAHLDHIPPKNGVIYNGADDNASGSAGVLEIAEAMAMNPPKRSVIFILYTAEEMGLFGSRHFVNHCPVSLDNILCNINLDMIGRSNPENRESRTHYVFDADRIGMWLKNEIIKVNKRTVNWPLVFLTDGSSDQKNFLAKDIPAAFFFSGSHEDLHRPTDDPDKIDYDKMQSISRLTYALVMELANKKDIFYKTVRKQP